jgi:plastocyanin
MRGPTTFRIAVLAAAVLLVAACGDDDGAGNGNGNGETTTTAAPVPGDTVDVAVSGFAFRPSEVTITLGQTVRWTNEDTVLHTSTAVDGSWDQSLSSPFEFTPTAAGSFDYFCSIHPEMQAVVIVE